MRTSLRVGCTLAAVLACSPAAGSGVRAQTTAELDAYWAEVSRTVEEGDFEGYAALYHPDAVLVSTSSGDSYPIVHFEALLVKKDGWKMVMEYQRSPATREAWNALDAHRGRGSGG